jgi:putrescine aminotransferase
MAQVTRNTTTHGPPGNANRELAGRALRYLMHWQTQRADFHETGPHVLVEGEGAIVRDADGRELIDGTSILGTSHIGHGRAEMADAIADQVLRLEFASLANGFSNVPAIDMAERLAGMAPGDLSVTFFSATGAEAVEAAIKMARQYHRRVGAASRTKVIARDGSYHGLTLGALSATGIAASRSDFQPLVPGFRHVPAPYPFRPEPLNCASMDVGARAAEALEAAIVYEGPDTVAAFIAEPIPVPMAIRVPPDDYWPAVREICNRHGVLLIADEVFDGFGRTGRMFACEHWGLEPDILTLAKGITSGYVPLSATMATRNVADVFRGDVAFQFQHGATYAGHPVACAAGLTNLDILEREQLAERARQRGDRLMGGLAALQDAPFFGDVSGRGLLISLELVSDLESKAPAAPKIGAFVKARMADLGVIVRYMPNSLYFYPPLTISEVQVDRIVEATRAALEDAGRRFG